MTKNNNRKKNIISEALIKTSLTDKAASLSIIVYCIGYLINSTFLRSFGIVNISIVKSDFIASGIVFIVVTLSFIVLPLLYFFIRDLKIARDRPLKGIKRSYLIVLNYCLVLILFSVFITKEEWNNEIILYSNHSALLKDIFLVFFILVLCGIVVISIFEGTCLSLRKRIIENKWFNVQDDSAKPIRFYDKFTELFIGFWRWVFLAISAIMDYLLIVKIHWFFDLFWSMKFYLGMTFILVFSILRLRNAKRDAEAKNDVKLSSRVVLIGVAIIPIITFLVIFSYSFSVYRFMPTNRGGMMPLHKTIFYLKHSSKTPLPFFITDDTDIKTKSLYLLYVNEDYYYITEKYTLKQEGKSSANSDNIWAIKKSDVINMERVRANPRYE